MGNSPSSQHPRESQAAPPQTRSSKLPKNKKRSIVDHPQLLALAAAQSPSTPRQPPPPPPPSEPIPIPALAGAQPRIPPPPPEDSTDAIDLLRTEHSTHRPIQYNSTRSFGAVRRGGVQGTGLPVAPSVRTAFVPELVRSSIPLRLAPANKDADEPSGGEGQLSPDGRMPYMVVWPGGGKDVFLAGTFDELEWRARQRMRFDPMTQTHMHTLHLTPGTYRFKFIVDDAWRCSETLPTATDDETGNLVNYVDILSPSPPVVVPTEVQAREARVMKANRRRTHPRQARFHPPQLPPDFWDEPDTDTELENVEGWSRGRDGVVEKWTSTIPEPLMNAARQEEAYFAALQVQREVRRGGAGVRGTLGFGASVPSIPPAPKLPRHLDKVLLNVRPSSGRAGSRSRVGASGGNTGGSAALLDGGWAQADDSSVLPVPSHVVLHHLGTSAIKNGVLAISDTTRYNSKYITTIYYKPA